MFGGRKSRGPKSSCPGQAEEEQRDPDRDDEAEEHVDEVLGLRAVPPGAHERSDRQGIERLVEDDHEERAEARERAARSPLALHARRKGDPRGGTQGKQMMPTTGHWLAK